MGLIWYLLKWKCGDAIDEATYGPWIAWDDEWGLWSWCEMIHLLEQHVQPWSNSDWYDVWLRELHHHRPSTSGQPSLWNFLALSVSSPQSQGCSIPWPPPPPQSHSPQLSASRCRTVRHAPATWSLELQR